jgi:hypothetical protein
MDTLRKGDDDDDYYDDNIGHCTHTSESANVKEQEPMQELEIEAP